MFNVRRVMPWIHVRPEQMEDGPPGFRVVDPRQGALPSNVGLGDFGRDADAAGMQSYPASYPSYNSADLPSSSRYPTQEIFDQLAQIYGLSGGFRGRQHVDAASMGSAYSPLSLPGADPFSQSIKVPVDQSSGDVAEPTSLAKPMVPQSGPIPERPSPRLMAPPPAVSRQLNADEGQVLSDAASDDGLREGQQYAQYRPPVAIGGMKVGVDEAGRPILVPDDPAKRPDPFEKLKQHGYPQPADDPGNGSAVVRNLREKNEYGQHRPNYHRFEFKDPLCDLGTPGCSVEAAYEALLRHALPGGEAWGTPIQHEKVSPVSLKGLIPGGRVQTLLDRDSGSVIHLTMPDHLFRDGYLQRQIVADNGKIYIRTFGQGNNASTEMATANNLMVRPAFEDATARIRAALRPPAPSASEVEWPR